MRTVKAARQELKYLKRILLEFQQDYDYAQYEEDLSSALHDRFAQRIGDVYYRFKEIEERLKFLGKIKK